MAKQLRKTWVYRNKKGETFGEVRRYDELMGNQIHKSTIPYFKGLGKAGIPENFPARNRLFGLDRIFSPHEPLFIVEGEKCAHALHGLDFQAVTSLGGCGSVKLADWAYLSGFKEVYLLPDNDEAGEGYMASVYERLRKVIPTVKVLRLPCLPLKGDVVDWLKQNPELSDWNEFDDLDTHHAKQVLGHRFIDICKADSEDVPEEWQFLRTKGNLKSINARSFSKLVIPERKSLLHPIFMEASINMVYAARGLGKTFFCLSSAVAMARGQTFLNYSSQKKTKVLYLDGEMQAPLMQDRIRMLSDGDVPENLEVFTPDFQELDVIPDLSTSHGQKLVDELIEETGAEMIFIDNISTFMRTGNENDADSWTDVQPWLVKHRAKRRSFTLVHHSNKAGDQRGSNKKEDVMDVIIHLSRPDDYIQGEDRTRLLIKLSKARHIFGEASQDLEAELDTSGGVAVWSCKAAESKYDKAIMMLKEAKLTQQEIAEDLKVNKATVTKWKKKAEAGGLL